MSSTLVVWYKELVDGLRDRRSLASMLLFPFTGPALVALMLSLVSEQLLVDREVTLAVVGREHAPGLVSFLERQGLRVIDAPADATEAVRRGDVDVVLIVPEDYGERFRSGRPVELDLVMDVSRNEAQLAVRRSQALLEAYGARIGALRLLAHGVSADLARPVTVHAIDLSTPKKRAALFLNLIPMFVLLSAFIGGMYLATDATAGERERGSLEPLLLTPVGRRALVVGKWLAAAVFSMVTTVLTLVCVLLALYLVPAERLGLTLELGVGDALAVIGVTLPLCLCASAAQTLVASFARSFKEAQTYLSFMVFLPVLPAILFIAKPAKSALWMAAVPVLGQQVLVTDIIRGEIVPVDRYPIAALCCLVVALVLVELNARLLARETIVYGR
jgi:sodium transport system permease protein